MAILAMCSVSGAPGVTTTAVGLAVCWPRPVLVVESDPTGGSGVLAGYLRGETDFPYGLVDLAVSQRQGGSVAADLSRMSLELPGTQARLLPGIRSHGQAHSLGSLWEPLGRALVDLAGTGQDVIIDLGRLGLAAAPLPLLQAADLTLLMTRSDLPALAAARSWVDSLAEAFGTRGEPDRFGLGVIGPKRPYPSATVAKTLRVPVLAEVAWDPESARVWSAGEPAPRTFNRSRYATSVIATVPRLSEALHRRRELVG